MRMNGGAEFNVTLILNPLTAKLFNWNFTHLKLCLADAIHNFKWVKIIQLWQKNLMEVNFFQILLI